MGPRDTIKSKIRAIQDFPKPGITFRDSTTLIADPKAFSLTIQELINDWKSEQFNTVVAIDARGFIFGSVLAHQMNKKLVLARKKGKLPAEVVSATYELEYGTDQLEIHRDAIDSSSSCLVVDDLIATGGTAEAAGKIIKQLNGNLVGFAFVIGLPFLNGTQVLSPSKVKTLVEF
ncbi:adenine phosphoribosyltransferase [Oligoflexaceae bacterium]|nr:adenine phosphoribosyltransferase [Oligoflexaceae bacterium]